MILNNAQLNFSHYNVFPYKIQAKFPREQDHYKTCRKNATENLLLYIGHISNI